MTSPLCLAASSFRDSSAPDLQILPVLGEWSLGTTVLALVYLGVSLAVMAFTCWLSYHNRAEGEQVSKAEAQLIAFGSFFWPLWVWWVWPKMWAGRGRRRTSAGRGRKGS